MSSLFQSGKYGVIDKYETTKNGFYVIQFISEAYAEQNNTQFYWQVIYSGELVVNVQYIFSIQENSNCYWKQ